MHFMRDKVIDVDANDRELWERITDVPKVSTPWQYICFILNVIIPGKLMIYLLILSRNWNYDRLRVQREVV